MMSEQDDLVTLSRYPPGEWVFFTSDRDEPLDWVKGDLLMSRFHGLVESRLGPQGMMGPVYHRLTEKGRKWLTMDGNGGG